MFKLCRVLQPHDSTIQLLRLYDQIRFYPAFLSDLEHANSRIIIECPFITTKRLNELLPLFENSAGRGVKLRALPPDLITNMAVSILCKTPASSRVGGGSYDNTNSSSVLL